jgi:phosphotransferase system HPr (HPr) family protein
MQKFTHQIQDENGLHARPAGLLVEAASKFISEIGIIVEGKEQEKLANLRYS